MYPVNIGLVKTAWHQDAVNAFADSCSHDLIESSSPVAVQTYEVPGVVEIPLFTRKLIESGSVNLVVVVGLVADHGVYRHDFVAATVMDATMKVQMETGVPIIYGILTPQEYLSEGRAEFFTEHFVKKGREAAKAALMTLDNQQTLCSLKQNTG